MGTKGPVPGEMVAWEDKQFSDGLTRLDMEGVIDLIRALQQEMAEEQEDFNALKEELAECDHADPRRSQEITELLVESQDRLGNLMNKMGQCFKLQEAQTKKNKDEHQKTNTPSNTVSSPKQRSPSPQDRIPSPTQISSSPPVSVSKSQQIYTSVQHSSHENEPSQTRTENVHKGNLAKLNKLVSSHKGGIATTVTSQIPTADLQHSVANGDVIRSNHSNGANREIETVQVKLDVSHSNTKPKTDDVKQPNGSVQSTYKVTGIIPNTNAVQHVSKTTTETKVVSIATVPNNQVIQPKPSNAEPVKLRSNPKQPVPIKRLSVSEARHLFENQPSTDSVPIRRSSSRGSINKEAEEKAPPPWVREEQERDSSLVNVRATGNSPVDQSEIVMKKNATVVKVGNETGAVSFIPKVRKAWEQPTYIKPNTTVTVNNAPKQTAANSQNVPKNTQNKPKKNEAISAVSVVNVTPKSILKPQKPVQNSNIERQPSKTPTKVTLRTDEPNTFPILPNKDLLRDITNSRKPLEIESISSHVIEDEEPMKFAVHLKPVSARSTKSEPVQKPSHTSAPAKPSIDLNGPEDRAPVAVTSPITQTSEGFTADEKVQDRVTLKQWDPTLLLNDLYAVKLCPDSSEGEMTYVNMEGYMEKLPLNKKKATLLKTWKKRYFKAFNGNLYYYESVKFKKGPEDLEKATGCLPLGGGSLEHLNERMLGIDDGRGRYLIVRCLNDKDYNRWTSCLTSQIGTDVKVKWVRPVESSQPHPNKNVVVIDIGSCSVRAGILGEVPSLPQLFFPTVVAIDKTTEKEYVGYEVAKPSVRANSDIIFPVRPSVKIDKFSLNMDVMPAIFRHVFKELKVKPRDYWVMFSAPANFTDKIKEQFMSILINTFNVCGVNIVNQTLLALYSYNSMSGIVVDIGERLEIVPVTDGYIVEQGVSRQPYGGHAITQALNSTFTEKRYRFFTDVEFQIVRLAMEKMCFVSEKYDQALKDCNKNPEKYRKSIDMTKYELPQGSWTHVTNDIGRFKSTEGVFNLEVWGMDNPPLQKLIQTAVLASPMDTRREMWRSIYLSGGVTLLPGFVERLEKEVLKLAPPNVPVEIHASPQRYHAAFIGACALAGMSVFQQSCISANEWTKQGPSVLRKWHMY